MDHNRGCNPFFFWGGGGGGLGRGRVRDFEGDHVVFTKGD